MLVTATDAEVALKGFPSFVSERKGMFPPTLAKHQEHV